MLYSGEIGGRTSFLGFGEGGRSFLLFWKSEPAFGFERVNLVFVCSCLGLVYVWCVSSYPTGGGGRLMLRYRRLLGGYVCSWMQRRGRGQWIGV